MTATTHASPVRPTRLDEPNSADRLRATVALARIEAVRAVRHPITIAAVLLFLGPWLYGWLAGTANRYPVLQDEDRGLQFLAVFLLGGAAMVVGNLAMLRPRRHGTAPLYDVLVLPAAWRTAAHLLVTCAFGLLTAALVAVRVTVLATAPGAAGRLDPYELAITPVAVMLLGVVGVLLGRVFKSILVALLTLLALGVLAFTFALPTTAGGPALHWFLPVALQDNPMPLPVDLLARPAAAHLVYLIGLVVLVAVAVLARAGARGPRLVAVGVVGLLLAAGGAVVQSRPVSDAVVAARIEATEHPAGRQTCQRIDQVSYCAFPDFAPWVDGWDEVLRGVLRRVPAEEAQRPMAVRQRVWAHNYPVGSYSTSGEEQAARADAWRSDDLAAGTPNTVTVGTRWGDGETEAGFAGLVAYEVITRKGAGADGEVCGGARSVLIAWLAGQATAETGAGLRDLDDQSWGGVRFSESSFRSGVSVSDREMTVAWELLQRPADEVGALVLRSWAELSAAETTTERVGEIFGVPIPPQVPENERSVCTA